MRRLGLASFVVFVIVLLATIPAAAAGPYPSPLPDFAHPGALHDPLYSPYGGTHDRPMLVIFDEFTDRPAAADRGAAWAASAYFGGFPSVADYYKQNSFGQLVLSPAAESEGAANDGVVLVHTGDAASFAALSDEGRNKAALQAADPFVNFAAFDANNDGNITDDELVTVVVTTPINPTDNCGATRGVDALSLDGKNVATLSVAGDANAANLMTQIHEVGHVVIHQADLYGYGVGALDLSGPTCGAGEVFFDTNAWQKTHVGWIAPTVVTKDGFYTINDARTNAQAFILYDPNKGTNDYFIVENRERTANTYDQSAADSGLVIWRVDDSKYGSPDQDVRPVEIMRPDGTTIVGCTAFCYGGSNGDAWDPHDPASPQRAMTRSWRDGSAAAVAVRAIGPSGGAIRAYFDVRGPGVLVDPANATGDPHQFDVVPEESTSITFNVMNTGEASDTFAFTVTGLPAGWSATTDTKTLAAGAASTATVQISVPADAATGVVAATAVGTSTSDSSVTSNAPLALRVVLHQTQLNYNGSTSAAWGTGAGFSVQAVDVDAANAPVAGANVTFTLSDGTTTLTATAVTNASGVAAANPTLSVPPGNYNLSVNVQRKGKHDAAAAFVFYDVLKRPTALTYSGDASAQYSDPAQLRATLTDAISGTPLSGKLISFTLGTQGASGTTNAGGLAAATITITQPSGGVTVGAAFAEDDLYLGASDADPFSILKEQLTFAYSGDTLVGMSATPNLAAQATQDADGSPGDLALAGAAFHLAPTLTLTPFDYATGVNAAGQAAIAASGLPVDLWNVTVSVPASNPYWTGATTAATELVVYDPDGNVTGGPQGPDAASQRAKLNVTARYQGSAPKGNVKLDIALGSFSGSNVRWVIVVGNQAIVEVGGQLNGAAATLRVRLLDGGEPAHGADTFRAVLKNAGGVQLYDSGVVTVDRGNLQVRS